MTGCQVKGPGVETPTEKKPAKFTGGGGHSFWAWSGNTPPNGEKASRRGGEYFGRQGKN